MGNINKSYIEEYIRGLIEEEDALKDIREYGESNNVPIIEPEVKQLLKVLLDISKPKKVLEVGTAIGYSALAMATTLPEDSRIITIERNPEMIELAKSNIREKGYEDKIKIIEGDAQDILSDMDHTFDMVFLDGAKGRYQDFLDYIYDNLKVGGLIVADNVLFKGMIATDELVVRRKKTIVKRMRSYLEHVSQDDRLETSIIPIGDGVAISYKRR